MRSFKFLAGAITGVALVVLVTGLLLAGIRQKPANAAGNAAPPHGKTNQLEQTMMLPISDAEWGAAAATLGMTDADFTAAINGGQSVANLGAPRQVTGDQVRAAMVAAGTAVVNSAVQDGSITQADADALNQGLVAAIAAKVTHANSGDASTGETPGISNTITAAELSALASALDIPLGELKPALDNPTELATLAAAQQVSAQQLNTAMVNAGQQALDQAVASGTVGRAEAESLHAGLVTHLAEKLSGAIDMANSTPAP